MAERPEPGDAAGDQDDDTVDVRPADDPTVAMGRDDDETVQVVRDEDATVAVAQDEDATVQVVRDEDATVAMSRDGDETVPIARGDETVRIVRGDAVIAAEEDARNAHPAHSSASPPERHRFRTKPVMAAPRKRRRGELHPAPVPAGYGERAVRASGAGAVTSYRAREIPRAPVGAPRLAETARVQRIADGAPSVRRQSRRFAAFAVAGFAASCVVSVVGIALIARSAFGL